MNNTARRVAVQACVGALVVAAPLALAGTANAAIDARATRMTAHSSDDTPLSGQQFVLRGRMTSVNGPVSGATVRVQSLRNGAHPKRDTAWEAVPGAVVTTNDMGQYRVRMVLNRTGERDLRVIGNPAGTRLRNGGAATIVWVH